MSKFSSETIMFSETKQTPNGIDYWRRRVLLCRFCTSVSPPRFFLCTSDNKHCDQHYQPFEPLMQCIIGLVFSAAFSVFEPLSTLGACKERV